MKKLLFVLPAMLLLMSAGWRTGFDRAKEDAAKEHKLILLNFSGSDWCGPCRRLDKNIFSQDTFKHFAEDNLVMLNADFPRKKDGLDAGTRRENRMLARKYQRQGVYPYTVLLDADGKVLAEWRGYTPMPPEEMIGQIQAFVAK